MGQPLYYTSPLRKRNDYTLKEIEKKYSNHELSQLVLFDNLAYYPEKKYHPDKLCSECLKNPVTKKFQLSDNTECLECYEKGRKENYDYILKCIQEGKTIFRGDCILENKLYLGGIESSFAKETLKQIGITHILMVGYFMTPLFPEDFTYENIEINDNSNENILQHLIKGIKFIDQSKSCYTHCQLGKSRSASFVIAYVMYKNKIHFSDAFNFVKSKRRLAFPNEGFQWQLEDFDIILSNFDYDLEKCQEFIQNYFENIENLKKTEKKFLKERSIERVTFESNGSDCESISDYIEDGKNEDTNNEKDAKHDVKEGEFKTDQIIENKENKDNDNKPKNETEEKTILEGNKNLTNNENNNCEEKKLEKSNGLEENFQTH